MGSLIPGWERPGQRVDSFRLRGGAPSQASLTPTPITHVRTHSALENGDNGGGGTGGPGPRIRGPGSGTGVPVLPGAAGGGGAPPPPPGAAIGPITGNIDIAAIVTVVIQAATTGYASTTATANAGMTGSTRNSTISKLKWLHLRMVCGVATNTDVPKIWSDVAAAPNKQEGLVTLVQYLMSGMSVFRCNFLGHADPLHVSIALYNFVAGDRFINPGDDPAYPADGLSMWTSL